MVRVIFFIIFSIFTAGLTWGNDLYPELDISNVGEVEFQEIYESIPDDSDTGKEDFEKKYSGVPSESKSIKVLGKESPNPSSLKEAYSLSGKSIPNGKDSFSFKFFNSGQFTAKNNSLFNTIFESGESTIVGPLVIGHESYFGRSDNRFQLGYLVSAGVNFFQGTVPGPVGTGDSSTKLTLWVVPISLGLNLKLKISDLLGLKLFGGVSVAGMVQSRSDYRDDETGKNVSRFGQGLFGGITSDFSLGRYFPKYQSELFDNYGFTNFRLLLSLRFQDLSFNGESNELDFHGSSLGAGISFDSI
tara:strand:+ start:867 stop:1772 length:906 start_codon:yes stop_codon:yes gene_type:complete